MKRQIFFIRIIAGFSFYAGYEFGNSKIADSKISILDDKNACPYLRENSSENSQNGCPYLNKNQEAENKCPYLEGKIHKEESGKKLIKTV